VCCHIAFFQFENEYFRSLLFFLHPGLEKLLPKAASTIRGWVVEAYKRRKEELKIDFQEARSAISIPFDLWTSPNSHVVLSVVAHFIDKRGRRRNVVLGLREVLSEHSGENRAGVLVTLFKGYGICGNIGYFMADNAESNDTCIEWRHSYCGGLTFLIGPPTNWQTLKDALTSPALEMMPVYRGWRTWASAVCGPAVVGIGRAMDNSDSETMMRYWASLCL
jgi:hypothetical protein